MIFEIDEIEERIKYKFKDKMLLRRCFTHSSYAYEHNETDNELLEFFGDSIIEFVVTEYLYKNSGGDEGKLTEKRSKVVSKEPLLRAVNKLKLSEYMLLGNGQKQSSNKDEKLYSSLYEALVAGIYIDGGLANAKKFITDTIIADFKAKEKANKAIKISGDGKNAYQEFVQKRKLGSVGYEVLSKLGPDHSPEFRVAALLNGHRVAEGKGQSKKQAEAVAASEALKKLQKQDGKKN